VINAISCGPPVRNGVGTDPVGVGVGANASDPALAAITIAAIDALRGIRIHPADSRFDPIDLAMLPTPLYVRGPPLERR
jgi:hypothetical protein